MLSPRPHLHPPVPPTGSLHHRRQTSGLSGTFLVPPSCAEEGGTCTITQEREESHPAEKAAARACFAKGQRRLPSRFPADERSA